MNYNARTIDEAKDYLSIRYNELASIGISLKQEINYMDKAIISSYSNNYSSIYILDSYRGRQLYSKLVKQFDLSIMTMDECNIVDYLKKIDCKYIVVEPSKAYIKIKEYYGDKTTERSGVKLINHIDEGIAILNTLDTDQDTIDAYCLHPLLQSDDDFNLNISSDFGGISSRALFLAVEYRRVANSYLSTNKMSDFVGFTNEAIEQMLYADKKQNEKDFALYHEGSHPRSKELREYFNNWIKILLKIKPMRKNNIWKYKL